MTFASADTDGDDLFTTIQVNAFDGDLDAKDLRLEGNFEVVVQHREDAGDLLGLVVGVDRSLLDERVEVALRDARL